MKSFSLLLLLLLYSAVGIGQTVVKGVVQHAETGAPVPSASIFLANTSVGTTSASNGLFTLTLPAGKFELIVSSVGYETYNLSISSNSITDFVTIRLQPKAKELETVVVEPFERDGWEKWGKFFLDNFIGHSEHAKTTTIKNKEVIKFRHNKKANELTVIALEPIQIENKSLGYNITYQLEGFSYDFKTNYLLYQGYPFFQPAKGGAARQRQWEARRKEVYEGSVMHFMRSLYRNQIMEDGFQVRRLQKVPNEEKIRVKAAKLVYTKRTTTPEGTMFITDITPADSVAYFNRIMAQPDVFDVIGKTVLPGDSIAYAVNSTTAGLHFDDYLLVIYNKKEAPEAYVKMFPKSGTAMASQVLLVNGLDVEVQANGSYFNPVDLLSLGYWAWSEKMATLLPIDYLLPQKGK